MDIFTLYQQIMTFCGLVEIKEDTEIYTAYNSTITVEKCGSLPVKITFQYGEVKQ